ncbi:hypothetical protein K9B35_15355 [Sphingomonas sp. R647]|uniref:tetratricopeptide repeat protein n=1 Tax=Sphingomonas sp. R647 TaxID=2875233 RepID=UPI001CD7C9DB|nr:hypothetical protein [Sphingomonas sp. R647]MCA1199346.1 hypothetical protein [Sphingomonas sp. R647]
MIPTPDQDVEPAKEIVVVGTRLRDAYAACLARHCPPREEVEAAMKAAVESFRVGDYDEAKATLRKSASRNRRHAAQMPTTMADLYATLGDVAEHEGDDSLFRTATLESVAVLRRHLGPQHPTTVHAKTRIGDMLTRLGHAESAEHAYLEAAEQATRAGNLRLAGELGIRRAWVTFNTGDFRHARRQLDQIAERHAGDARLIGMVAVMRARILLAEGKDKEAEAVIAALQSSGGAQPPLLFSPEYESFDNSRLVPFGLSGEFRVDATEGMIDGGSEIRWVDIGFWIRPDGTTEDAAVLRSSKGAGWAAPLIRQVAKRRYGKSDSGDAGFFRVERFTLRPSYAMPTGSRLARRLGPPTLHSIDLTQASEAANTP